MLLILFWTLVLFLFSYLSALICLNLCFMPKIFKLGEQNVLASLQKEKNHVPNFISLFAVPKGATIITNLDPDLFLK